MKAFLETTSDWSGKVTNHVYYLSDDKRKLYGFCNMDTKQVKMFKNPMGFETRYRTFVQLKKKSK